MKQDAIPESPFSSPRRASEDERVVRRLAFVSGALQSRLTTPAGYSGSLLRDSTGDSSDSSLDGVRRKLTFEQNRILGVPVLGPDANSDSDDFQLPWDQY